MFPTTVAFLIVSYVSISERFLHPSQTEHMSQISILNCHRSKYSHKVLLLYFNFQAISITTTLLCHSFCTHLQQSRYATSNYVQPRSELIACCQTCQHHVEDWYKSKYLQMVAIVFPEFDWKCRYFSGSYWAQCSNRRTTQNSFPVEFSWKDSTNCEAQTSAIVKFWRNLWQITSSKCSKSSI